MLDQEVDFGTWGQKDPRSARDPLAPPQPSELYVAAATSDPNFRVAGVCAVSHIQSRKILERNKGSAIMFAIRFGRCVSKFPRMRLSEVLKESAPCLGPFSSRAASSVAAESSVRKPLTKPSFFRRAASSTGRALLFTSLGFVIALAPTIHPIQDFLSTPPTDAETLSMYVPQDADAQEKEAFINSLPMVAELRANPDFTESRPHLKIPSAWRAQNLTGGTLMGPRKVTVPPFTWSEKGGKSLVQIMHVGTNLCGHVGIIHGGFIATLLDEGLGRCCFPALPHNIGMTATLEVNYKVPARADQYLVLRATTTMVEGRKAWIEGRVETLPNREGEEPTVLATAKALYISPRQAALMDKAYPVR